MLELYTWYKALSMVFVMREKLLFEVCTTNQPSDRHDIYFMPGNLTILRLHDVFRDYLCFQIISI